jgi:hypothetical protein
MEQHFGEHLSIDAFGCNDSVRIAEAIEDFGDVLIKAVDMLKHGNSQMEHFGNGGATGWTYSQLITTSNLCIHFCDDGKMFFDLFSCKSVDVAVCKALITAYFAPEKMTVCFRQRG